MLSMSTGYDPGYLTRTAAGAENYYLSAAAGGGEPAGRWTGRGCATLGLSGDVNPDQMSAVYAHLLDPRDPEQLATLGKAPRAYKSVDDILAEKLASEPEADAERLKALTLEASKTARSAVLFHDATFSPTKSVSLLHAGYQAAAVEARAAGDVDRAQRLDDAAEAVWDAVRAGSAAALDYLQDEAGYSRTGYHGAIPRDPTTGRKLADHSTGQFVDAHEWVVASFAQHTSRNGDPQMHIHNAILNRVECPDGQWRTIDSRGMRKARAGAAAIGERVMEEQLTRTLGVEFAMRPDGKAREILGIDQATRDLYSSRRSTITAQVAGLVAEYENKHGHAPSRRALFAMSQYATLDSKSRKRKSENTVPREVSLAGWEAQARAAELGALADLPASVSGRVDVAELPGVEALGEREIRRVLETAVADVESTGATWTRHQMTAAINRALPDCLGGLPAPMVRTLLAELTADALTPGAKLGVYELTVPALVQAPAEYVRANGRSVWEPGDRAVYATRRQLAAEDLLIAAGAELGGPAIEREHAAAALGGLPAALEAHLAGSTPQSDTLTAQQADHSTEGGRRRGESAPETGHPYPESVGPSGQQDHHGAATGDVHAEGGHLHPESVTGWTGGLRDDQAAAVYGILTSGRRVDLLVGPAGAGKSRAMGELSTLWREHVGGKVVGLAVAQAAADVLAGEGFDTTHNVAKFLTDARAGNISLRSGDLVVVDEASMVTAGQLAEIERMTASVGAKLLGTGDPEQLAAVGDAGAFAMLAREHGYYQLTQVQRMGEQWERDASLSLRKGEVAALTAYDKHGRLMEGSAEEMTEEAYRRWLADYLQGKSSVLLAPTVKDAQDLADRARAELIALGHVKDDGLRLRDEYTAGRGDLIMARRNERAITDATGRRITNRDVMRIEGLTEDGGVLVRRDEGRDPETGEQVWSAPYPVPGDYLKLDAELAYASTVHAAQGRTVDTCHSVVTPGVGRSMLYVMMTRGREGNYAYTVAEQTQTAQMEAGHDEAPELAAAADRAAREAAPVPTPEQARAAVATATPADGPAVDRFAVLVEAITADEAELTATERLRDEHLRATHLGHLGAMWTEVTREACERRYNTDLAQQLTAEQYERYAAADEAGPRGTFTRLLRSAELAGHDVVTLVERAVTAREIDEPSSPAESVAKILHHRVKQILGTDEPTPVPQASYTARTPQRGEPELIEYARELAEAMDARAAEVGERVAREVPEWALTHLGPVPSDPIDRHEWVERAAAVEAFREQYDRLDERDAIGHTPDTPEARAGWHAAFAALGRPEAQREIAGLTDGELWVERAAYARAARWCPPSVAEDLRETTIAAARARADATLTAQHAAAEREPERRVRLEERARAYASLADVLEERRGMLTHVETAREQWHTDTERERARALESDQELRRRHPDAELPPIHHPDPVAEPPAADRDERVRGQLEFDLEAGRDDELQIEVIEAELVDEREIEPREPVAEAEREDVITVERVDDAEQVAEAVEAEAVEIVEAEVVEAEAEAPTAERQPEVTEAEITVERISEAELEAEREAGERELVAAQRRAEREEAAAALEQAEAERREQAEREAQARQGELDLGIGEVDGRKAPRDLVVAVERAKVATAAAEREAVREIKAAEREAAERRDDDREAVRQEAVRRLEDERVRVIDADDDRVLER